MRIDQLLVDARECTGPLDDADALAECLRNAARAVGAEERGGCHAEFVPHGVTAVIVLAQSHMSISTWPEHRFAMVDILFCNPSMGPQRAWVVLEKVLKPAEATSQLVTRTLSRT